MSAAIPCGGCGEPGHRRFTCSECQKRGINSIFCSSECYVKNYSVHKRMLHAKLLADAPNCSATLLPLTWNSIDLFMTGRCEIKLATKRLDEPRIFKIKSDPLVNRTQLYGQPYGDTREFTDGYVLNNIPLLSSSCSRTTSRNRYVWAITIGKDATGKPLVEPKRSKAKYDLNGEGYIGNIAIELSGRDRFGGPARGIEPNRGLVFRYPSVLELDDYDVTGTIFYELHPNFWGQGLMTEALGVILRYAFDVLRLSLVVIDPLEENVASQKLARHWGGKFEGKIRHPYFYMKQQDVYRFERKEWYENEKTREGGTETVPVYDLKQKTCRWCQAADTNATVMCTECDWAWYCTEDCRRASSSFSGVDKAGGIRTSCHFKECTKDAKGGVATQGAVKTEVEEVDEDRDDDDDDDDDDDWSEEEEY